MSSVARALLQIKDVAGALKKAGAVLSGEAAAHAQLAAATGWRPGAPPNYLALPPRRIEAIYADETTTLSGVTADRGLIPDLVRSHPDVFTTTLVLGDGTQLPVLTREAVLAQLLATGGLAVGLCGILLRVAGEPPVDVDHVREILKATRHGESFQPLLELVAVI